MFLKVITVGVVKAWNLGDKGKTVSLYIHLLYGPIYRCCVSAPTDPGPGYMIMDAGRTRGTAPIPIRNTKEVGYMDMGPSSQTLPTVKEGGSKLDYQSLYVPPR